MKTGTSRIAGALKQCSRIDPLAAFAQRPPSGIRTGDSHVPV
jgi:hypothetical protein